MKYFIASLVFGLSGFCSAQDDLLSLVEEPGDNKPGIVYATFKTVRIGNAQSIETVKKKHLDFRISHRFGNLYDDGRGINRTFQTFLGFDEVSDVRFSLDYGITDDITVALGRSKMNKLVDGSIKYRFLHQTADFKIPVSVAFFGSAGYSHAPAIDIYGASYENKTFATNELHRFNYFSQFIIACKVNEFLSLELLPSYMHRNYIVEDINTYNNAALPNSFFSVGFGGRIKLSKRASLIGDYFYNFSPYYQNNSRAFNPLSLGFELETGGHVFSLVFTNAAGLVENNFVPLTSETWTRGQVKFGFTISRTFAL